MLTTYKIVNNLPDKKNNSSYHVPLNQRFILEHMKCKAQHDKNQTGHTKGRFTWQWSLSTELSLKIQWYKVKPVSLDFLRHVHFCFFFLFSCYVKQLFLHRLVYIITWSKVSWAAEEEKFTLFVAILVLCILNVSYLPWGGRLKWDASKPSHAP